MAPRPPWYSVLDRASAPDGMITFPLATRGRVRRARHSLVWPRPVRPVDKFRDCAAKSLDSRTL